MYIDGKRIYTQTAKMWKTFDTEHDAREALIKFDEEYEEICTVRRKVSRGKQNKAGTTLVSACK